MKKAAVTTKVPAPAPAPAIDIKPVSSTELIQARKEVSALSSRIVGAASALVVKDDASYAAAEGFLSDIDRAKKTIKERVYDRIIRPIRVGLDALYAMQRDLEEPLTTADKTVRTKMKAFIDARREQERLEREEREAEERRLLAEAEERRKKAESLSRTAAKRQEAIAADLDAQRAELMAAPVETAPKGTSTTARITRKARVVSLTALVRAVAKGDVPEDVLEVNSAALRAHYSRNPEDVATWPGIEIVEDTVIARR